MRKILIEPNTFGPWPFYAIKWVESESTQSLVFLTSPIRNPWTQLSTHIFSHGTSNYSLASEAMAAQSLSATSLTRPECKQFKSTQDIPTSYKILQCQWLGTVSMTKLSLHSSNLRPIFTKRPPVNATISFSLPTA